MSKIYCGVDNGNGTIAIIYPDGKADIRVTPIKKCLSYTKKVNYVSRFDVDKYKEIVHVWLKECVDWSVVRVGIERPYTSQNPLHKKAVMIGMRIHEAQIISIEQLGLSYAFYDSEGWQKMLLPAGITGSANLKKASLDIGRRKWPDLAKAKNVTKDFDALFLAEYMRQQDLHPKTL